MKNLHQFISLIRRRNRSYLPVNNKEKRSLLSGHRNISAYCSLKMKIITKEKIIRIMI